MTVWVFILLPKRPVYFRGNSLGANVQNATPRTDRRFPLYYLSLDLYDLYGLYDLAHVAGGEPYNLGGLRHISLVRYCEEPARHLITVADELDDLLQWIDIS